MALDVVQIEVGLLQNFCEVIGCPATKQAALVDPAFEVDHLLEAAAARDWQVTTILLTHTHTDHIDGLAEASEATGAIVRCHPFEVEVARKYAPRVQAVADNEQIALGDSVIQAVYAPGHTSGCVCWYLPDAGAIITGDVLFVGSCGSVRFPSSDSRAMYETLQQRIASLPEETIVYPGHDYGNSPTSTVGWEIFNNPALAAGSYEAFCQYMRVPMI